MAAATEVEETESGNEHNSLKHRQNPEKHVIYKRKLQIQPPPLETRAEEAPPLPLAPQPLEEAPPVLLEPHLTKKKKNSSQLSPQDLFVLFLFWVRLYCVEEGSVFLRNTIRSESG
jgi:hypothetical protein